MATTVSSGLVSENTQIYTGPTFLCGVQVITDGTNDVIVRIYDGTSTQDQLIGYFPVTGINDTGGRVYNNLKMGKGIYLTITGTGGKAIVDYVDAKVI